MVYKVVKAYYTSSFEMEEMLNDMEAEGWELV